MWPTGTNRSPKAVHAARVDDIPVWTGHHERQKRPRAVIDAPPADSERPLPLGAVSGDEAASSADTGIVEEEMDVIAVGLRYGVTECENLLLVGNVAQVCSDPYARRSRRLAQVFGFR